MLVQHATRRRRVLAAMRLPLLGVPVSSKIWRVLWPHSLQRSRLPRSEVCRGRCFSSSWVNYSAARLQHASRRAASCEEVWVRGRGERRSGSGARFSGAVTSRRA